MGPLAFPVLLLVIYSIILHEIAHAYIAYKLGDPTAKMMGRITLNPISHIDPLWTVILPILFYVSSGGKFVLGGAKPVPININNFRKPRRDFMLSSMAGPLTNIMLSLFFLILAKLVLMSLGVLPQELAAFLFQIFLNVAFMNFFLTALNMLPIPPLDGSRLVRWLLPREHVASWDRLEQSHMGMIILVILLWGGFLNPVFQEVFDWFNETAHFIFNIGQGMG